MTFKSIYWSILTMVIVISFLFSNPNSHAASQISSVSVPNQADGVVRDRFDVEMIFVPAGDFIMGVSREKAEEVCIGSVPRDTLNAWTSEETETYVNLCLGEHRDQSIFHPYEAEIEGFWIDKYEVSYEQLNVCPTCINSPKNIDSKLPITNIDWFTAYRFCTNRGARLPTEEEWEYAASGPDNHSLTWGGVDVHEYFSSTDSARPVGANEWDVSWIGVYDMAWNVSEWVDGRSIPYPDFDQEWPFPIDTYRVLRGGGWASTALFATTYVREHAFAEAEGYVGFRCARTSDPREDLRIE